MSEILNDLREDAEVIATPKSHISSRTGRWGACFIPQVLFKTSINHHHELVSFLPFMNGTVFQRQRDPKAFQDQETVKSFKKLNSLSVLLTISVHNHNLCCRYILTERFANGPAVQALEREFGPLFRHVLARNLKLECMQRFREFMTQYNSLTASLGKFTKSHPLPLWGQNIPSLDGLLEEFGVLVTIPSPYLSGRKIGWASWNHEFPRTRKSPIEILQREKLWPVNYF